MVENGVFNRVAGWLPLPSALNAGDSGTSARGSGLFGPLRRGMAALVLGLALTAGVAAALVLVPAGPAQAESLAAPEGEVVLVVRGHIGAANTEEGAAFDLAMLEALPRTEFTTGTVWTEGASTYTGVLLRDLLAMLGAEGSHIVASALDGYQVVIPLEDLHADGPIIAYRRDGRPMPRRDRGPLWVLFPFDDNPAYRNETSYGRSIWQLTQIAIEE